MYVLKNKTCFVLFQEQERQKSPAAVGHMCHFHFHNRPTILDTNTPQVALMLDPLIWEHCPIASRIIHFQTVYLILYYSNIAHYAIFPLPTFIPAETLGGVNDTEHTSDNEDTDDDLLFISNNWPIITLDN